jgi:hypothetical protein
MFNIDNLLNSPIIIDPWRHQIIKNFFQEDDFKKINLAAIKLETVYKDRLITADACLGIAEVYDIIGEEVFDIILEANRKLLDNIKLITKNFPKHNKFKKYISVPSFHILPPQTPWQKIHDESLDKTTSIVVYLYPKHSVGTTLYKENNRNSKNKEIEWEQNSAMLFCGQQGVTWHDFCSREHPRITLNFFLRKPYSENFYDDIDRVYYMFDNGMKTYIPKSLPETKFKLITENYFFKNIKDEL